MKIYVGIGSRKCPPNILSQMEEIGKYLATNRWILRSGGSDGSDRAFETGCDVANGIKEIYLPWQNFNGSNSALFTQHKDAFILASTIHPAWDKLSYGAKKLHARNCHQLLGHNLKTPADIVICWTSEGKEVGGSATVLKLAKLNNIRIINLALENIDIKNINREEAFIQNEVKDIK